VAFIGRVFVVIFALILASMASGMAIAIGLLGPEWHAFSGDFGERTVFWGTTFFATGMTDAIGFLPLLILIVLAEAYRMRSLLAYAAVGAVLFLLAYYGGGAPSTYEESIDHPPPPISREGQIAAAAGIVFGLTYWLIAGRNAGRWRERAAA